MGGSISDSSTQLRTEDSGSDRGNRVAHRLLAYGVALLFGLSVSVFTVQFIEGSWQGIAFGQAISWVGLGGVVLICVFLGTILYVLLRRAERAEDRLHSTAGHAETLEEDFRALSKWSPVGIFRTDVSGKVIRFNDKWLEVTGLTPEAATGEGWHKALHEDDRETVAKAWSEAADARTAYAREQRYQREDGSTTVCFVQAAPIIGRAGELLGHIGTVTDITEHRRREVELEATKRQLEHIALFDDLTGLPNRASCKQDLTQMFGSAGPGDRFTILQIDLDDFKRVNDTLGHGAGDHLLHTLGVRLSRFGREFGSVKIYRWGGDEFLALIPGEDGVDIEQMCEELTDVVAIPVDYRGTAIRPTVSLGVARYPDDGSDLEALMIFADLALYKTKELGRDGYQFFTPEMKGEDRRGSPHRTGSPRGDRSRRTGDALPAAGQRQGTAR